MTDLVLSSSSRLIAICLAEPFNDDGTYRVDIFFNTLNTTYIPLALNAARRADSHTKLYINDFGIEGTGTLLPLSCPPNFIPA